MCVSSRNKGSLKDAPNLGVVNEDLSEEFRSISSKLLALLKIPCELFVDAYNGLNLPCLRRHCKRIESKRQGFRLVKLPRAQGVVMKPHQVAVKSVR